MKNFSYIVSINTAKITSQLIKIFNLGAGSSLPGKIALKISPNLLGYLVKQTKKEIISVTGTNGKTTTSGFLSSILSEDKRKIAHNTEGANMLNGILTAVINKTNSKGQFNIDNTLLEIDEAYLPKAVNFFSLNYLIVTNLFRDQLDRYGELDTTRKKIEEAIIKTASIKKLNLILNADDPMVASLGTCNTNNIYYGINSIEYNTQNSSIETPKENINCTKCGNKLKYKNYFYGHLGNYYCNCGYKRPNPKITADIKVEDNYSIINVKNNEEKLFEVKINTPGLYNTYNALSAITLAIEAGIKKETIIKGIENYTTVFGRSEEVLIKEKKALIQLIKNPIGATEVIRTINFNNSKLLIIINDNYADGRDVSWLWDANFDLLKNYPNKIVISGTRAYDMATRLKHACFDTSKFIIEEDIKKALSSALQNTNDNETLYIIPTYTALLQLNKII